VLGGLATRVVGGKGGYLQFVFCKHVLAAQPMAANTTRNLLIYDIFLVTFYQNVINLHYL
jgi:hypothetical protein